MYNSMNVDTCIALYNHHPNQDTTSKSLILSLCSHHLLPGLSQAATDLFSYTRVVFLLFV